MDQIIQDTNVLEKRSKPRAECDYPAIVKGQDTQGRKYEEIARLTNLSANGLYLQVNYPIVTGEELLVTISLPNRFNEQPGPKITTTGVVVRTEQPREGLVGVGLKILHYKFV